MLTDKVAVVAVVAVVVLGKVDASVVVVLETTGADVVDKPAVVVNLMAAVAVVKTEVAAVSALVLAVVAPSPAASA